MQRRCRGDFGALAPKSPSTACAMACPWSLAGGLAGGAAGSHATHQDTHVSWATRPLLALPVEVRPAAPRAGALLEAGRRRLWTLSGGSAPLALHAPRPDKGRAAIRGRRLGRTQVLQTTLFCVLQQKQRVRAHEVWRGPRWGGGRGGSRRRDGACAPLPLQEEEPLKSLPSQMCDGGGWMGWWQTMTITLETAAGRQEVGRPALAGCLGPDEATQHGAAASACPPARPPASPEALGSL